MAQWGYTRDNGPHTWTSVAPAAAGKRQSPIDISKKGARFDSSLGATPLKYTYVPANSNTLLNTGHSVQVVIDSKGSLLEGGPLKHKYAIAQFHFHWGKDSSAGAEHTVDGKTYAAEGHLVHYNTDLFPDFASAAKAENGLCVLGVFLEAGKEHAGLKKITDKFPKVSNKGGSLSLDSFDPACLLPGDTTRYWTYPGSLTTPPCFESVTWVVFKEPIEVSEAQLQAFRSLATDECLFSGCHGNKTHIADNNRPVQALNGREVKRCIVSCTIDCNMRYLLPTGSGEGMVVYHQRGQITVNFTMNQFRQLCGYNEGEKAPADEFAGRIFNNYRPPLPLHNRSVVASFNA